MYYVGKCSLQSFSQPHITRMRKELATALQQRGSSSKIKDAVIPWLPLVAKEFGIEVGKLSPEDYQDSSSDTEEEEDDEQQQKEERKQQQKQQQKQKQKQQQKQQQTQKMQQQKQQQKIV